ncbi:RNA recognition motif domain-containing protein [Vibrio viridaestus]|uniref:RNA-binding protein n=1 Tax=Vibrio viridaestus TaxID=2487322 RepID=A0A3N9TBI6_9VIBR|nr:RNA-binding protein [Vibrio viridaestus]RQW61527.1 RNA-binding protein [Vibrio viridaestus]
MNSSKITLIVALILILGIVVFLNIEVSHVLSYVVGVVLTFLAVALTSKSSKGESSNSSLGTTTLYVGNLPYKANESHVKNLFADYGEVFAVRLMKDKKTGKRRGFGFVVMSELEAPKAIDALNEHNYMDRTLKVRVANDPKSSDNETDS